MLPSVDGSVTDGFAFWNGVRRMPGVCVCVCVCVCVLRYSANPMVRSCRTQCLLPNSIALQPATCTRNDRNAHTIRKARDNRNGKIYSELISV